jgi:hypothetical protein
MWKSLGLSFSFSLALIGIAIASGCQTGGDKAPAFNEGEVRQAFTERDNVLGILIQKVTALETAVSELQHKKGSK